METYPYRRERLTLVHSYIKKIEALVEAGVAQPVSATSPVTLLTVTHEPNCPVFYGMACGCDAIVEAREKKEES